jgi:hypothetical protein
MQQENLAAYDKILASVPYFAQNRAAYAIEPNRLYEVSKIVSHFFFHVASTDYQSR